MQRTSTHNLPAPETVSVSGTTSPLRMLTWVYLKAKGTSLGWGSSPAASWQPSSSFAYCDSPFDAAVSFNGLDWRGGAARQFLFSAAAGVKKGPDADFDLAKYVPYSTGPRRVTLILWSPSFKAFLRRKKQPPKAMNPVDGTLLQKVSFLRGTG